MHKGRLFTFGCSFTSYYWPTWADILGREFEEIYNRGRIGAGNFFIATSIAETVNRHNINTDDTVLVMWTNVTREDRYLEKGWVTPGNIFTQKEYSDDFIKKFITIRGCYVRDMAQIFLIDNLLQSIGCKYKFMSMVDMNNSDQYSFNKADNSSDVLELYKPMLSKILPSVHKVIFNYDYNSRPFIYMDKESKRGNFHPTPMEHAEYLSKILPEYTLSEENINSVKEIDDLVKEYLFNNPSGPDNKPEDFFKKYGDILSPYERGRIRRKDVRSIQ